MPFEKTKAASADHTEEDVEKEEDLKTEEDTSTDEGQSDENGATSEDDTSTNDGTSDKDDAGDEGEEGDGDESSVDYWKQRAEKAEQEKDNYKQGMLSAKAKKRNLDDTKSSGKDKPDVNEQVVLSVLERQSEQKALREVINPKSNLYIPELIEDAQYNEIITYLPRSLDKSSVDSIHKALKLATKMWKEDKGIQDKPKDKGKDAKANLASSKSSNGGKPANNSKPKEGRKIIKQSSNMKDWYS